MTAATTASASVTALYTSECQRLGYTADAAQQQMVAALDDLRTRLLAPEPKSLLQGLLGKKSRTLQRGLYAWGGVGRGKTWVMDLFFQSLPFKDKQRVHFHRFMQSVHDELKKLKDVADPLEIVADKISRKTRLICFDEFFVADIADAMLLGTLFGALFNRGVALVATSNVPPDDLYKDGLQRARFVPAIRLLKEHTTVLQIDGGADYRLRLLKQAAIWFDSQHPHTAAAMEKLFVSIAGETGKSNAVLTLNHRRVPTLRLADDVIWFDFDQLCDGPRGQADYIEIAKCYHTVMLSNLPVLGGEQDNQARRFITMIDEYYDRGVKLIVSAASGPTQFYAGTSQQFEMQRTQSRLIEMQSQEYLSRPHQP